MSNDENKALVLSWFKSLVEGDMDTAVGNMHEDFRCFFSGTLASSGWGDSEKFFSNAKSFGGSLSGPVTTHVGDVTAEGDRVWFEAVTQAPLRDGGQYRNMYVMAVRVRDGKIIGLKEYGDTHHVFEVMEAAQSPSSEWQSPLEQVTDTLGGGSTGSVLE
jgi:ketosteroid isomerase-like protein